MCLRIIYWYELIYGKNSNVQKIKILDIVQSIVEYAQLIVPT